MVVLDHDTAEYVTGFELAPELVAPGGTILIDNVAIYGEILTPDSLLTTLAGEAPPNERTAVVADFLARLRDDETLEAYLLSVGEGVAVAYRLQ